jgi:uncharacterized protein
MKKLLFICFSLLMVLSVVAQNELPQRPNPPTLVTDLAGAFSQEEQAQLEQRLVDYFAQTSTQIAVVTVPDLQGYEISDYAVRLAQSWGIGSEKFDNGILVLLKPKNADGGGKVFIAVGYGLEGAVPDATAKQIIENEMIPRFKNGDIYGGVVGATNVLIDITKGEYNYKQYAKKTSGGGFNPLIIFIIIAVLFSIFRPKRGGYYAAGRNSSLPFWLAMGLMNSAGRNHSGSFGNFSSGSGSFGGGSSFGGFGGFGGGGFGGGGAGGSW